MEIRSIDPFLKYFQSVRERTMRVARCIPADKVDWSYAPGKFTTGDLVRHIAITERYLFADAIEGRAPRYTSHGGELAQARDEILALMDRLHAESMEIFAKLTDDDLQRKCQTPGSEVRIAAWLRAMIEHETHHRGQLYVYLGLVGVETPSLYGLTSEEVRARNRAAEVQA